VPAGVHVAGVRRRHFGQRSGEECDDGTTANNPGQFCNKERRCVGGENGCNDANTNGRCDSNATENGTPGDVNNNGTPATRLGAPFCETNLDCVKGTCGLLECAQNTCGDGILGGNEYCDDGNVTPPTRWGPTPVGPARPFGPS